MMEEIMLTFISYAGYILLLLVIFILMSRSLDVQCFLKRLLNKKKNYGILDIINKDGKITSYIAAFSSNEVKIGDDKMHVLPDRVTSRNGMPYALFTYNDALKEIHHYDIAGNLSGKQRKIDPEVLTNTLKIMLSRSAADPLLKAVKNLTLFNLIQIGGLLIILVLAYVAVDNSSQALGISKAILAKTIEAHPLS